LIRRLLRNKKSLEKAARLLMPGNVDYKVGEALRNINKTNKRPAEMFERNAGISRRIFQTI